MVQLPNCFTVTILEHSTTEVTLPSCLSVPSEHVGSQSKWQSADLDLVKLAKKRKSVWPALFRGNVCIQSDKISNVNCKAESEPKHEVAIIERKFKFRKKNGLFCFGFFKNCAVTFNVSSK